MKCLAFKFNREFFNDAHANLLESSLQRYRHYMMVDLIFNDLC